MIDPHVHCRDGKQAYKETIKHVLEIAEKQGVKKIFDMPNTDPPILFKKDVQERLKLVPKNRKGDYFLYVGATANKRQLEEFTKCYNEYNAVIGIKLYAGKSVGNLAVIGMEEQKKVYRILSELNFKGVIAVHCEKENYLKPELWNPSNPITHSYTRPKKAEIESITDQIKFAREANFKGVLHIVHVSCPESIELIEKARKEMKITCGVTPHHILWSNEMLNRPDGLLYKINPPLRDREDVKKLRQCLKEGKIDWIETDHAPHSIGEKLFTPFLSGYPSLYLYKDFVSKFLPNMGVDKKLIKKLTFENIYKIFETKLK
jgi:dihydroorotase